MNQLTSFDLEPCMHALILNLRPALMMCANVGDSQIQQQRTQRDEGIN